MTPRRSPPPGDLPRVFRGSLALAEGLVRPSHLRGSSMRRLFQDVYAPAWHEPTHELSCEAAGLVMPERAAITGRSAATLRGVPLAGPSDPVEVCVPEAARFGPVRGMTIRRLWSDPMPTSPWRTTHIVAPHRMAFDLAAKVPLALGVAYLDAVCRRKLVDVVAFQEWLSGRHDDDVRRVRAAAALVDPASGSIPESVTRVHLVTAGIDVVPQYVVRVGHQFVARVDMAVVHARVAIEYDGAWHALREQLERDRARLNRLREAGWTVVHVTAASLRDPAALVDEVRRAVAIGAGA